MLAICELRLTGFGLDPQLCQAILELVLGVHSDQAVDELPTLEDQDGRDGGDTEFARNVGVFVGVKLADLDLAQVFGREFVDGGGKHPTGSAPGSPEVHNDGNFGSDNFRLPIAVGKLHHVPGHDIASQGRRGAATDS